MWYSEIVVNSAEKDAERELGEFRKWLDTPPPSSKQKPKSRPRWSAEDEMALFENAKKNMKGG